jgi:short-subunit dehydrogenase
MGYAMVTGGTSGIGLAFANELAAHGCDLILVARDAGRLASVGAQLQRKHGVTVEAFQADLANRQDVARVVDVIENRDLEFLINNAGFGLHSSLLEPDTARQEQAMDVMATAVLILSGAAGRTMAERGHGVIINVASASAWIITGNYSAIKRWVITYTQALALELRGTGVQATAVCPGWVKTAFHERSGIDRPHIPNWLWVKAEEVVKTAIRDAAAGKVISIPTRKWRAALFVAQHGPTAITDFISAKIVGSRLGKTPSTTTVEPNTTRPRRAADDTGRTNR